MGILKGFGTHGASICSTAAYIGEPEAEALSLLFAVIIAAVCGLVYELLGEALSSYLLGRFIYAMFVGDWNLPDRDGRGFLPLQVYSASPSRATDEH